MGRFIRRICRSCLALVIAAAVAASGTGCTGMKTGIAHAGDAGGAVVHSSKKMEVHYIDVGQGDSTLVKCDGESMLIDAGDDTQGTHIRSYLQKQKVEGLKYLVLTHPDSDHIGGAPSVIENVNIRTVYVSNYKKDTKTSEKVNDALRQKGISAKVPSVGETETLGTAKITFLAPCGTYEDANDSSVALKVTDGTKSFLFTGDAETRAEHDMIAEGENLKADVYKTGHHGSRNASSQAFIDAVDPSEAVISCGAGNSYGHPSAEVLNRLRSAGIKVYRTDEQGTVIAETDGNTIRWNTSPSETWRSGEGEKADAEESRAVGGKSAYDASVSDGTAETSGQIPSGTTYVINTRTKKFHRPGCSSVGKMKASNRKTTVLSRDELIKEGYSPCKNCRP